MNKSHKKIVFAFSFVGMVLFSSIIFGGSAFADMKSSVIQKALMQGLYRCYTTGAITNNAGNLSSFHKFEKLIVGGGQDNYIALPTSLTDISDNNISCKGLLMGDKAWSLGSESGSFGGLFEMFGKGGYAGNLTSDSDKITLLEGMGYSPSEESSTKSCVYYVYDNNDPYSNGESYTQKVCLAGDVVVVEESNDFGCGNATGICEAPVYFKVDGNILTIWDSLWTTEEKVTYAGNWEEFKTKLNSVMSSKFSDVDNGDAFFYRFSGEKSANTQEASGDNNYVVENDNMSAAAEKAMTFLYPSYTKHTDIKFTDQEKLWYYSNTIGNWFFKGRGLDDYYRCGLSDNPSLYGNYVIININPSTNAKNVAGDCGVNRDLADGGSVDGFDRNSYFDANGTLEGLDLDGVVMQINMLVDGLSDEEMDGMDGADGGDDKKNNQPSCYDGSGPLGWILCPVIDAINNIGGWMWKNVIEYHLQIPASGVFESGGAVEQAWGIMRNIANVAFIILFLIVIFSQLTGVGIDNYGIKKILPRLIVVAILVNLSYIICELAVDLSNILGMGLNAMLSGFAKFATGLSTDPNLAAGTLDVALGVGGVGLFALLSNPAGWGSMAIMAATIGVMVLGIVLAMLVAVATLYLILIIREAGIILLIILAPVAMVCYMLPNTEKLYKKWFDLFKALLIVYPICGMMIGAGKLAGSVLAKIGNSTGAPSLSIAAMIVQVLPFFLIPKLLKSSLQLMGNVGARLSDAGKRLGAKGTAKVEGAIKGSERFKNLSQYQQERTAANRASRVQARLRNRMASGKTLSARDQDRLRRADDTVLAWKSREAINGRRTSEQSYAARQAAIATEDEKARVADYESLIENGRARNNSGSLINVNDPNSVGTYHAEALARYEAATNDAERSEAMSQIKAAQNILSKTDKGRAQVQNNLAAALQAGQVSGLSGASAHLMSNFGDTYKNKNRGAHEMIRDLATTDLSKSAELTGLQSKLTNGKYAFAGTKSYTAETLAGADDAALDKFVDGVTNGSLTGNELANIQATAYEALQKAKSGTLNIKPEVSQKLEQIVGNNYVPVAPNNRAAVLSHGAYEDSRGNVVHLREMDNGKYLDDGGFEVDITHYKKR